MLFAAVTVLLVLAVLLLLLNVYATGTFFSLLVFSCTPSIVLFFLDPVVDDNDLVDRLSVLPLLFDDEIEVASDEIEDMA